MSIERMNNVSSLNTKKKTKPKKSILKYIFNKHRIADFSKFDPETGEKFANSVLIANSPAVLKNKNNPNLTLAKQEIIADSLKDKESPIDWLHALKSGTVGTSGGFVLSQLLGKRGRIAGLMSLGLGGLIAGLDAKRQLYDYNKQMAARELLSKKRTPRSIAYAEYIRKKYLNNGWVKIFQN